jgi:hypothetical protein
MTDSVNFFDPTTTGLFAAHEQPGRRKQESRKRPKQSRRASERGVVAGGGVCAFPPPGSLREPTSPSRGEVKSWL